jgi:cation diffusion facilitator family transporter
VSSNRLQRSLHATFIGMVVNVFLATGKLIAGVLGHSHALVADAVESFADIFSSLIVWRGVVVAAKPADEDHPYGHGKAEPIAAAVVSLMLLLAAGWIAVKSVEEISEPHLAPAPFTLAVLIAVIVIKETLFRFVLRTAGEIDSSAVRSDAWHHRSDAITSLAAGIGITVSLIGGKGCESADDWAALAAAGVIAFNGISLLRPALNELMDRAPAHEIIERINALAGSVAGVDSVEKTHVRKMGYQLFVDMHLEVNPQMTVLRSHEIAHEVKDKVRAAMPNVSDVLVHIEPLNIPAKRVS